MGGTRGPALANQYLMNYVIEPSAEGARGKQYVIEININDDPPSRHLNGRSEWEMVGVKGGEPSTRGGHYDDVYVRTPQGWRFKRREFIQSASGVGPASTAALLSAPPVVAAVRGGAATGGVGTAGTSGAPSLTPMDYIEIEQLVANTVCARHRRQQRICLRRQLRPGRRGVQPTWREPMVELQRKQARAEVRPSLLTNMLILRLPTAPEARTTSWSDLGEGKPNSIYIGGHYEDSYEKTPDGWRFRNRTLIYSKI